MLVAPGPSLSFQKSISDAWLQILGMHLLIIVAAATGNHAWSHSNGHINTVVATAALSNL